jgi:hypothetical protein
MGPLTRHVRDGGEMGVSVRFFIFVCLMLTLAFAANDASARSCGRAADRDNPMVWSEGLGVSQCRVHRARYHTRKHEGEAARGYASASDPMVWSDTHWRSTLMDGYSRNYDSRYDRRFRRERASGHHVRIERRVELTILADDAIAALEEQAPGPKHLNMRTAGEFRTNPGVLRFAGHDCRGVLVLTWGSLGSKSRCHVGEGFRSIR